MAGVRHFFVVLDGHYLRCNSAPHLSCNAVSMRGEQCPADSIDGFFKAY